MSLPALDNLVRIGQLKVEPRNDAELARMLARAHGLLMDAVISGVSASTRLPVLTVPAMRPRWRRCAGMATAAKTASRYFNA